ncbi:hypothetical protein niasHS_000265 [Heterodera schachtii]|uniref:Tetratricopeptide repeat protein 30 n=1 Tax=Heterodera schachtii TaxID=97005 RepID=A0ABD2KMI2_HETSC
MAFVPIKDGEFTSTIYAMIKENKFTECIRILQYELQRNPESRAALSLLGYCYHHLQDFIMAAECYEKLSELFPQHTDYRICHAQSLYNAYMFPEAVSSLALINEPKMECKVVKLDAAIKYREEDVQNARILVEQFDNDDPDMEVNLACLDYKEGNFEGALRRFTAAMAQQKVDESPASQNQLTYAIALCHYQMHNFPQALQMVGRKKTKESESILIIFSITEIINRTIKDHQELGVGMGSEVPFRSVGNTLLLHESAVVEACNLKFAIEYRMKNMEAAAEALSDLPARMEEELDPVTLHNQALLSVESNLADSFSKLQYLLGNNPFPPETFANLLLLYCKFEYFDLAADVLAENAHLTYKLLNQFQFDYLDALITQQSSESEAYAKFDALAMDRLNELRKKHQKLQELREEDNGRALQRAVDSVEETIDEFLPALMAQAKLLWDKAQWAQIEQLFRHSAEFCHANETWKLNLAHTLFMQEKYKEASDCYAPLVHASFDRLLDVSAVVLANLCACYIFTTNTEEAEEVMRRVEREENAQTTNRKFGISRIVCALEPYEKKLGMDTWFYSKRCMASMLESIARCVVEISDNVLFDCLHFLESCELHGREIVTDVPMHGARPGELPRMISHEARLIRALLLKIMD